MQTLRALPLLAIGLLATLPAAAEISLTAPGEVPAGSAFDVTWSPGDTKGRIQIVAEDGSKLPKAASYGYTNPKKESISLTAPVEVGKYGIVFMEQGKEPAGLITFETTPVTATLSAPDTASIGETITIKFEGPTYAKDLISFGNAEGEKLRGLSYTYPGNSKDGTVKLRAPMDAGDYTVIYSMSDVILAKHPVKVGGAAATLEAPETVQAGGSVDVVWEGPDNSGDFITLFEKDGKRASGHAYTGNSKEGAVSIEVPEQLGAYELRYVSGGKTLGSTAIEVVPVSAKLGAPPEVTAGFEFEVKWDGPGNRQDRILMHTADAEEDSKPVAYSYLDPENPVATLTAPSEPGDHILRYRTGKGSSLASVAIKIVPAPEKPGKLTVHPNTAAGFGDGAAVEVILDASGSMLQKQDGKRRIDIAKDTLKSLVTETIPEKTPFALRVFGHKDAGSCRTDLEVPLTALDPAAMVSVIGKIEAKNLAKTPIAASLTAVASDLSEVPGERIVILLTDGEETCDGDPALAIRKLRAGGTNVRVNIVGYAIEDEGLRQTFESWAILGKGRYLNAPTAEELAKAMKRVLALPYKVYKGDTLVAQGIAGEGNHELPAGDYTLRFERNGETLSKPLTVLAEKGVEATIP